MSEEGFFISARKIRGPQTYHDYSIRRNKALMLPIFSMSPNSYQMDTMVQPDGYTPRYFLIVINVNSRKGYAYPMANKGLNDVLKALNQWIEETPAPPETMTSDQDAAYLSTAVVKWLRQHKIDLKTTTENNHNMLGIINRFIRTIRDMHFHKYRSRIFSAESMEKCVRAYNNSVHSSTGVAPNKWTKKDNKKWVSTKIDETNAKKSVGLLDKDEKDFSKSLICGTFQRNILKTIQWLKQQSETISMGYSPLLNIILRKRVILSCLRTTRDIG